VQASDRPGQPAPALTIAGAPAGEITVAAPFANIVCQMKPCVFIWTFMPVRAFRGGTNNVRNIAVAL
jgi:hypothetical protein